jgi:hypothetical protein
MQLYRRAEVRRCCVRVAGNSRGVAAGELLYLPFQEGRFRLSYFCLRWSNKFYKGYLINLEQLSNIN